MSAIAVMLMVVFAALQLNTAENTNPIVEDLRTAMPRNSIAVLPFVDMSERQDQQYFGDGIAEEILTKLTEFPELVVMSRTSSFLFRDRQQDVAAIGRSLNSAHVLEGSIRRAGNQLRITAQLIETRSGTHVWSQSFDRELTVENLLGIQSEVAVSVAETIASGAAPIDRSHEPGRRAANAEAYDAYLEGMYYLHQIRAAPVAVGDAEVYEIAIERFEASIEHDSEWALPHAALGRTLHFRAGFLQDRADEGADDWYRLAEQHLQEAIRLEPGFSLAYSSLGHVLHRLHFDFQAAEAAYDRARELGDYSPWGYAVFLAKSGRPDEAIEQYLLAIEREPLLTGPRRQLAGMYRCVGRYENAIAELEKVLRMVPGRDDLYIRLAYLYLKAGNFQKGQELFEQHRDREAASIRYGPIFVLLGEVDKAYEVLKQEASTDLWWLEDVVSTLLTLGDEARALEYLEAAASDDPRKLMHVLCLDGIDVLADNPRYHQVLKAAGMPEKPL